MLGKFAAKVKLYYDRGIWTAAMVRDAYIKDRITADEYDEILGELQDGEDETDEGLA